MGNRNVNSEHVKFNLLVLDEVEQVLEFRALDLASKLDNQKLELNDELKFIHVGSSHVNISLVKQSEHVFAGI